MVFNFLQQSLFHCRCGEEPVFVDRKTIKVLLCWWELSVSSIIKNFLPQGLQYLFCSQLSRWHSHSKYIIFVVDVTMHAFIGVQANRREIAFESFCYKFYFQITMCNHCNVVWNIFDNIIMINMVCQCAMSTIACLSKERSPCYKH